ncbi:hypothetical protein ASPZODRAFT_70022 [Penicilliopsis zonata CBS 506.65]|uniref:Ketoreductase domain-containing protein n=1 Tax=Penicilliopsis zonata CBS 506.65 TaxID=1073090 RepID=A0A1L9SDJ5_9EURO|nr:hypothetical protein ASPZODRAFT_70022 [Penicilliopsis zonata CBS 506.65]OJJ45276.1 hypothetical protein ASPZODRAFT_70022 [Penicilliopsis zonata CBS 506.65]
MATLFNLQGHKALVTGGGRGIGQAMAIGLAEAGADIVLILRTPSQTETKEEIERLGRKCWVHHYDLAVKEDVSALVPDVLAAHPDVDILLNAAGIQRRFRAEEYSDATFEEVMQVNVSSAFSLCRDIGQHWIANNVQGRIINTASLASFQGGVRMAGYAVSKGGIAMLTKALSNEWAGYGIRVNAIAPGYIATDMNADTRSDSNSDYYKSITQRIPMGRWGDPRDFKGPAVFLASDASSYMTGEIIMVDGGWMAR